VTPSLFHKGKCHLCLLPAQYAIARILDQTA
jgi:hypothetical protein